MFGTFRKQNVSGEDPERVYRSFVLETIRAAFALGTSNGEVKITVDNILPLMKTMGLDTNDDAILDLIRNACLDGYGEVDPYELDKVIMNQRSERTMDIENEIKTAFEFLDYNRDGYLTINDIYNLMMEMGEMLRDEELYNIIRIVDSDGDGVVTYADFKKFLLDEKDISCINENHNDSCKDVPDNVQPENGTSASHHVKDRRTLEEKKRSILWGYVGLIKPISTAIANVQTGTISPIPDTDITDTICQRELTTYDNDYKQLRDTDVLSMEINNTTDMNSGTRRLSKSLSLSDLENVIEADDEISRRNSSRLSKDSQTKTVMQQRQTSVLSNESLQIEPASDFSLQTNLDDSGVAHTGGNNIKIQKWLTPFVEDENSLEVPTSPVRPESRCMSAPSSPNSRRSSRQQSACSSPRVQDVNNFHTTAKRSLILKNENEIVEFERLHEYGKVVTTNNNNANGQLPEVRAEEDGLGIKDILNYKMEDHRQKLNNDKAAKRLTKIRVLEKEILRRSNTDPSLSVMTNVGLDRLPFVSGMSCVHKTINTCLPAKSHVKRVAIATVRPTSATGFPTFRTHVTPSHTCKCSVDRKESSQSLVNVINMSNSIDPSSIYPLGMGPSEIHPGLRSISPLRRVLETINLKQKQTKKREFLSISRLMERELYPLQGQSSPKRHMDYSGGVKTDDRGAIIKLELNTNCIYKPKYKKMSLLSQLPITAYTCTPRRQI